MILDARGLAIGSELAADVVVIGAGPAGLAVASGLGARAGRVLIVESGGAPPAVDSDLAAGSADRPYYDLAHTRIRGLGGSTASWGGWCERLRPVDVAVRPWIPLSGWCLGYDELDAYYPAAEEFCGVPATPAANRTWRPAGAVGSGTGTTSGPGDTATEGTVCTVVGTVNLADRRADVLAGDRVDLLLHATVTAIVAGPGGREIDHLDLRTAAGETLTVRGGSVVLATGGVENARLLLASTSTEWPDGLGNRHDQVGRYFMEHPHVDALRFQIPDPERFDLAYFDEAPVAGTAVRVSGALTLTDTVGAAEQVGRAEIFVERAGLHLDPTRPPIRDGRRTFAPRYAAPTSDEYAVVVVSEQVPNPKSRVTLGPDRDRFGVPRPHVTWKLTDIDHRTIAVAASAMRDQLRQLGARNPRLRFTTGRWPRDMLGGPHHLGTTRMDGRPEAGVVDRDSRVHGLDNLYVAGGSVFPTGGYAPPTLTIVALALRLADHLTAGRRATAG